MFACQNGTVRVLLVEDTAKLAQLLSRGLREEGWEVDVVGNGEEALRMVRTAGYDLIVLDGMLPDLDGVAVCRRLRDSGVRTLLLMLSARDAVADLVAALDAGADDYLVKPFAFEELLARLRALIRRAPPQRPDCS